ncbi:MAG TPA: 7-cyano-7-deazaguanine synthase QueC [Chthoniobacterales bacterium]|nr:7-cyano-7-deazaguanine synthase QueC [Chthoniobacterales bacterium]
MKRAVVLLSGGLDSAATLAIAKQQGFDLFALSFNYGQRHSTELDAARRVAQSLGVNEHRIVTLGNAGLGGSALTDSIDVPKSRSEDEMMAEIPVTYVPARNTVFLAHALGWAETLGANDIFIGVNAIDYSGYPDCRPEFIDAFERLANLATKAGVEGGQIKIHAPLVKMSKAQIISCASSLGVDMSLTHSCYDPLPGRLACGRCDACLLRRKGFREAGLADPVPYAA